MLVLDYRIGGPNAPMRMKWYLIIYRCIEAQNNTIGRDYIFDWGHSAQIQAS